MKCKCWLWFGILAVVVTACNNTHQTKAPTNTDTLTVVTKVDTVAEKEILATVGTEILIALKAKDYKAFAAYFHPKKGVLFSPYGFIDTTNVQQITKAKFLKVVEEHGSITWGAYDGSGDAIKLTAQKYLDQFVYNADYLNADSTSFNQIIGKGNSKNNLAERFPNCNFLEYYFKGANEKYDGMDWTSLRLVFEKYQNGYFLVAVIHDQWTI